MTEQELQILRVKVEQRLTDMALHYQIKDPEDFFDDRIRTAMDAVLKATDLKDAEAKMNRAENKMHLHCLSLWTVKRALGPQSRGNFLGLAQAREDLANFREKRDDLEGAKRYRAQAVEFRRRAAEIGQAPQNPPAAIPGPMKGIPAHVGERKEDHSARSADLPRPKANGKGKGSGSEGVNQGSGPKGSDEPRRLRRASQDDDADVQRNRTGGNPSGSPSASDGRKRPRKK